MKVEGLKNVEGSGGNCSFQRLILTCVCHTCTPCLYCWQLGQLTAQRPEQQLDTFPAPLARILPPTSAGCALCAPGLAHLPLHVHVHACGMFWFGACDDRLHPLSCPRPSPSPQLHCTALGPVAAQGAVPHRTQHVQNHYRGQYCYSPTASTLFAELCCLSKHLSGPFPQLTGSS